MTAGALQNYLDDLAMQSQSTARTTGFYLQEWVDFLKKAYGLSVETVLDRLRKRELDVYNHLREYLVFLDKTKVQTKQNSKATVSQKVKAVRRFLEYSDVEISQTKFRIKVKIPRPDKRHKAALDKATVRTILQGCDDKRLYIYVLWLASSGWRSLESISLRWSNFDLDAKPFAKAYISGEFTKTKRSRETFLTNEMVNALKDWKAYKYRNRHTVVLNRKTGKYDTIPVNPVFDENDYVFLPYSNDKKERDLKFVYNNLRLALVNVLKRIELKGITFHSFRRFVYTTIDSLGQNQFAEFYIGHEHSAYWNKPEHEKAEMFAKVQPYLTYMDFRELEAKGADQQTRLDQLQFELQKEREERAKLYELLYKQGIIKKEQK